MGCTKGLSDVFVRLLLIILERLCNQGEVPEHWKRANVTHGFKKGKRNPSNCRQASLALIPGKVMEQLILKTVSRHLKDRWSTAVSTDLSKGNCVWPTWLPSMMRWKAWWVRGEPWMRFILERLLTLSLFNILTRQPGDTWVKYMRQWGDLKAGWNAGLKRDVLGSLKSVSSH